MTSPTKIDAQLQGKVFLTTASQQSFASAQIELLIAIGDCGSISRAAKQAGISYKTAWDRIDAMNNMSNEPLVVRSTGGAKGGGTALTEQGKKIIIGFQSIQQEHQQFIEQLGQKLHSLTDIANFINSENMKTSARNQFRGRITHITDGAVNSEVEIDIGIEQPIVAVITQDSIESLGLSKGTMVIALVKASSILVSIDTNIATSARNKLTGKVSRLITGAVNTDITIALGGGKSVAAVITNTSAKALNIQQQQECCAVFKASSVILLKEG